ncbi:MAG: hypothetical protein EZS28_001566 [Streblomastix strix]|uniref:Uncharacterized protein n=1 Tax=Streblomastix strix TaxID=222440 RepID=A0A5J4X6V0_9EUKA|nr:MAG: hypothetical protein EZS28_001566 [Streblomastix strix]
MPTDADLLSLDVLQIHDEILYRNVRHNTVWLIDQVTNINTQINMINNASAHDVYIRPETNKIFDTKADKTDTYTKTETDTLLYDKAYKTVIIDAYNTTETDEKLNLKANVADIVDCYSKTETDTLLDDKADKINTYTKTETDTLLDGKADKTDLANYVDLTSARTISGQKQFGIISVSSISKQSKNDASIPLVGGGDMFISSLVTQPQLQEVRDIATGKSKAYVFSSQEELNNWMAIQENVAKLVIGDNLYIVDKEVTEY